MLPLGFAAFWLFGIALVLVGANQDALARGLGLDLARSGLLAATLSAGIGLGVLLAGPLVDRFPRRRLFLFATLLAGCALVSVEPRMGFERLLVHLAVLGFGGGVYDVLLNVVAVQRYGARAARPVALLHAGATAGAVTGPPLVSALAELGDWTLSFRISGVAYLALSLWVALVPQPRPRRGAEAAPPDAGLRVLSPAILALAVVGFAYVGVETGATVFAVPYATGALGVDADRGRAAISVFWLGLLLGRLGMLLHRGRFDARWLGACGALGSAALGIGLATETDQIELLVGVAGIGLGAVFPLMVTLAAQWAPRAPGAASGLVAGVASLGGFAVPWLAGGVGDRIGVWGAFAVLAATALAVALFGLVAHVLQRRGAG
jgi:fucose permease